MGSETLYELLNFDIDRYVNPYIPHNRLYILPRPLQHILGYRQEPQKEPPAAVQWILTFIATLGGLCLVASVYTHAPGIAQYHPPVVVASLGASAILDYNAVRSPLAQPRNAIFGQTISALVGVSIAKLFQLNAPFFAEYEWVAGAVGCACASLLMSITNTVHPPGGATAILASTSAEIIALGWMFIPLVLLGSVLMMTVALIFNNTLRQYPMYWWTPQDVGLKLQAAKTGEVDTEEGTTLKKQVSSTDSERTLRREMSNDVDFVDGAGDIHIMAYKMRIPSHIGLMQEEAALLENLQQRIRRHAEVGG
ncbi:hypothetical protein LTR85_000534 [Meristemomyces frigidus]|nr:hypothetical protein LTR85_000534 [Meristemomyces frigidus]